MLIARPIRIEYPGSSYHVTLCGGDLCQIRRVGISRYQ